MERTIWRHDLSEAARVAWKVPGHFLEALSLIFAHISGYPKNMPPWKAAR